MQRVLVTAKEGMAGLGRHASWVEHVLCGCGILLGKLHKSADVAMHGARQGPRTSFWRRCGRAAART